MEPPALSSTSGAESTSNSSSSIIGAPVSDILLAFTKDGRYLTSLVNLLSHAVEPWLSISDADPHDHNDEDVTVTSSLRPELELIAYILHFGLVQWRRGRTLGMEHVGILYNHESQQQHRSSQGSMSILSQSLGRFRTLAFALLYILPPYLIRRAGRGGWAQLQSLRLVATPQTTAATTQTRLERLRGEARRRVYDDQRRRMMERIALIQQQESREDTNDEQPTSHTTHTHDSDRDQQHQSSFLSSTTTIRTFTEHIRTSTWSLLQQLSAVLQDDAPTVTTTQSVSETVASLSNDADNNYSFYTTAALKWAMRLHLALFFLSSQYPTFLTHRLLSVQMKSESSTSLVHINRPSFRVIGFLIVLQSVSGAVKGGVHVLLRSYYYTLQRARERRRRRHRSGDTASTTTTTPQVEQQYQISEEDTSYLTMVEQKVPSLESYSVEDGGGGGGGTTADHQRSSRLRRPVTASQSRTTTCGICMEERSSPAVVPCGHVFCWQCIQHWCTNVRPECPLCRASSLPQNVMALHGYS